MPTDAEVIDLLAVRLARLDAERMAALERLDCMAAIEATMKKAKLLGFLDDGPPRAA